MGGFLSPSPGQTTSSGTSTTTYTPSPNLQSEWQNIVGTMMGLTTGTQGVVNNSMYPGQMVASPTGLTNQYWTGAGTQTQAPDVTGYQGSIGLIGAADINQYQNPANIQLQLGQLNLPSFGNVPGVTAPGGVSGQASSYMFNPQQVSAPSAYTPQQIQAMMVSAPGSVNPITGVPNVAAPNLRDFTMQAAQNINAPTLQNYSMQAAGPVSAGQSWTAPGVAASFMSPYTQNVVNTQLAQAQTQEQQQLQQQGAQAAQAGAFGGSRQAVEAANTSIGYQQLAAQLEAQGLQSAYGAGQQQFNTQQAMGLQAALANQQAQQQANQANLQSYLQTQGLGTQAQMQAALANQANQQQANVQNLSSFLQTQGLGAQTGLQAGLANQSMSYQTQLANQQAQEFGLGQQMQAGLANQQAGLAAQQANQQAGLQAGLANMGYQYGASAANAAAYNQMAQQAQQMGLTGAQFTAGQGLQAALANQAARMQAQGLTYQGGLQGALQTQNLGLQAQQAQQGLQLQQQQQNLANFGQAGQMYNQAAGLGLTGFQTGLQGLGALQQGATSQQGYQQQLADAAYQQWLNSITLPIQGVGALAGVTAMQPYSGTTQNVYSGTGTSLASQPSILSQLLGGITGGLGFLGGLFGREGGLAEELPEIKKPTGLAAIPKRYVAEGPGKHYGGHKGQRYGLGGLGLAA